MTETTTETTTAEQDTRLTAEEVAESLTGYDELAVSKAFRAPLHQLEGTLPARALAFVLQRRLGVSDSEAYKAVMTMTQREVVDQFAEVSEVSEGN